jgi:hypothetical protein
VFVRAYNCIIFDSHVFPQLALVTRLQEYITDSEEPMEARVWVWTYYGPLVLIFVDLWIFL